MSEANTATEQLDALLQRRTGGQINIRGLRFQLLYALRRALELLQPDAAFTAVGLERFEDIDLYGEGNQPFRLADEGTQGGSVYLQAKTCDGRWVWSNLKKPIKGFLETLRADPDGQFWLVLNFALDGEPLELAQFATLKAKRQRALTNKFRSLCQHEDVGGTAAEADALLPSPPYCHGAGIRRSTRVARDVGRRFRLARCGYRSLSFHLCRTVLVLVARAQSGHS